MVIVFFWQHGSGGGEQRTGHLAGQGMGHLAGQGIGHLAGQGTGHLAGQGIGHLAGQGIGHLAGHGTGHLPGQGTGHFTGQGAGHFTGQGTTHFTGQGVGHLAGREPQGAGQGIGQGTGQGAGHETGHGAGHVIGAAIIGPKHHTRAFITSTATVRPSWQLVIGTVISQPSSEALSSQSAAHAPLALEAGRRRRRSSGLVVTGTSSSPDASSTRPGNVSAPKIRCSRTDTRIDRGSHLPTPGIGNVYLLPAFTEVTVDPEQSTAAGISHTICSWLPRNLMPTAVPQPSSSGRPHRVIVFTTNSN